MKVDLEWKENREKNRRKTSTVDYFPSSEDEFENPSNQDNDSEYVPAAPFTWLSRVTDSDRIERSQEDMEKAAYISTKCTDIVSITGRTNGERNRSTAAQFNKKAWEWAVDKNAPNASAFFSGGKNHYEWCHLQGDALGGRCTADNLVAGHFSLNTHMMAIESQINARTELCIRVTAYCKIDDIADFVLYEIFQERIGGPVCLWKRYLDGRNKYFSENDWNETVKDLKAHLPKAK